MEQWIKTGSIVVFLGVACVFDVKYKKIPIWILGIGTIWAVVYCFVWSRPDWGSVLLSLLPGMGMLGISYLTEEKVGYGDGWIILILGILHGLITCLAMLCMSLFFLSVIGMILMVSKKAHKDTRIPFAPFLLAAQCGSILMNGR